MYFTGLCVYGLTDDMGILVVCGNVRYKHYSDLTKSSFFFRTRVVLVKFGMRSRPSMLVISDGCGHASSSRTDLLPFEWNRGSKANVLSSMNKSAGMLTSTNSPCQTVVLVDGARSTWARRIACRLRGVSVVPYVHVVPSARLMIRLAGRIAMSLISTNGVEVLHNQASECTRVFPTSKAYGRFTNYGQR